MSYLGTKLYALILKVAGSICIANVTFTEQFWYVGLLLHLTADGVLLPIDPWFYPCSVIRIVFNDELNGKS